MQFCPWIRWNCSAPSFREILSMVEEFSIKKVGPSRGVKHFFAGEHQMRFLENKKHCDMNHEILVGSCRGSL